MGGIITMPKYDRSPTVVERFWPKVDVRGADECWPWMASTVSGSNYGYVFAGYRNGKTVNMVAHIVAWEIAHGEPVPPGLDIDHTCHNRDATCPGGKMCLHRLCCNASHLEAVTRRENLARGQNHNMKIKLSGYCVNGHLRADHGVERKDRPGCFYCRACRRLSSSL